MRSKVYTITNANNLDDDESNLYTALKRVICAQCGPPHYIVVIGGSSYRFLHTDYVELLR